MKCLDDAQIQAVVDREARDDLREHAASCPTCAGRVRERELAVTAIREAIDATGDAPPEVMHKLESTLASGVHGATRLRPPYIRAPRTHRTFWTGLAAAAATLVAVFVVAPMFKGPATVSANEILARSVTRMSERVTSGVEVLEYELALDGVPRDMLPEYVDGVYRVRQAIDHSAPGRYRISTYDSTGTLYSTIAQDPGVRRRIVALRLGGQPFRFDFTVPGTVDLSPPEMERLHMQASVAMMQASGDQRLQVVDTPSGRQYRVEVPHVSVDTPNAVWDLTEAQAVIDATDYHIVEFAVKGTFLKEPYSVSYRLLTRSVMPQSQFDAREFDVPQDPDAITVTGVASAIPARDLLVVALRELARVHQRR
jgi:hypothetical protein